MPSYSPLFVVVVVVEELSLSLFILFNLQCLIVNSLRYVTTSKVPPVRRVRRLLPGPLQAAVANPRLCRLVSAHQSSSRKGPVDTASHYKPLECILVIRTITECITLYRLVNNNNNNNNNNSNNNSNNINKNLWEVKWRE